jgi:hypothetical protein
MFLRNVDNRLTEHSVMAQRTTKCFYCVSGVEISALCSPVPVQVINCKQTKNVLIPHLFLTVKPIFPCIKPQFSQGVHRSRASGCTSD